MSTLAALGVAAAAAVVTYGVQVLTTRIDADVAALAAIDERPADEQPEPAIVAVQLLSEELAERVEALTPIVADDQNQLVAIGPANDQNQLVAIGPANDQNQLVAIGPANDQNQLVAIGPANDQNQLVASGPANDQNQLVAIGPANDQNQLVASGPANDQNQLVASGPANDQNQLVASGPANDQNQLVASGPANDQNQLNHSHLLTAISSDEDREKALRREQLDPLVGVSVVCLQLLSILLSQIFTDEIKKFIFAGWCQSPDQHIAEIPVTTIRLRLAHISRTPTGWDVVVYGEGTVPITVENVRSFAAHTQHHRHKGESWQSNITRFFARISCRRCLTSNGFIQHYLQIFNSLGPGSGFPSENLPGHIVTQPGTKIVFNAPYDDKHTYHIKIVNSSARRIGWAIKTTNMKRLGVDPASGVLDPQEATLMAVSCDAFAFGQEDTNNDRITVEWANAPDGAAKQFRREWFQGNGMVRRKNLPIEYNP